MEYGNSALKATTREGQLKDLKKQASRTAFFFLLFFACFVVMFFLIMYLPSVPFRGMGLVLLVCPVVVRGKNVMLA